MSKTRWNQFTESRGPQRLLSLLLSLLMCWQLVPVTAHASYSTTNEFGAEELFEPILESKEAALRLQVVELQVWYDMLNESNWRWQSAVTKYYGSSYDTKRLAEAYEETKTALPEVEIKLNEAKMQLAAYQAGVSGISAKAEPLTSDRTYTEIRADIDALEEKIRQQQVEISNAEAALQELVGEHDPLYPERKAAYDAAVAELNRLQSQVEASKEGIAVAAKIAGDALLEEIGGTGEALTEAAHKEMIAALEQEIADIEAELKTAKADKRLETAMNAAQKAADTAEKTWKDAYKEYQNASAALAVAAAAKSQAALKYQSTRDRTELDLATAAYEECALKLEGIAPKEAAAKKTYNEKNTAYQAAKTAYEEAQQEITSTEEKLVKKQGTLAAYKSGNFEGADTERLVPDLEGTVSELQARIAEYESELSESWESVPAKYNKLRQSADKRGTEEEAASELVENQADYAAISQRIDDLRDAIAQTELAIRLQDPPKTAEDAESRVRAEAEAYLRAKNDYQEFCALRQQMMKAEGNALSGYNATFGTEETNCPDFSVWNDAVTYLIFEYSGGEDYFYGKVTEAEDALKEAMDQLNEYEIRKEKSLTSSEIDARVRGLQLEYESARTTWNSLERDDPAEAFADSLNKYAKAVYFKNGEKPASKDIGTVEYTKISEQRPAWQEAINKDEAILEWENAVYSRDYIEAFQNLKVLEAQYSDENGRRSDVISRIEKMGDQYALQVCTGSVSGTGKILFFTVVYTDSDGFERKEYIFPGKDDYTEELTAGNASALVNQDHVDAMTALGQGGSVSQHKALESWSADTYLFRSQYQMADTPSDASQGFHHFEMFGENVQRTISNGGLINNNPGDGSMTNEWACTGMRLYSVEDYYGLSVSGYGGSSKTRLQLEFKGTCIGEMVLSNYNPSWACDKMFIMDPTVSKIYAINYPGTPYTTGKVGEGSGGGLIERASDESSEYLFKLDIADHFGAGAESQVNFVSTSDIKTKLSDMGLAECLTFQLVYYDTWGARRMVELPVITSSIAWATQNGVSTDSVLYGYAQQGDSLVFSAYLPDMARLDQVESKLVFKAVDWAPVGGSSTAKSNISKRQGMMSGDTEILLDGIQIYAPGTWSATASVQNGVVIPEVSGEPTYYAVDNNSFVVSYDANGSTHLPLNILRDYTSGAALKPKKEGQMYMLVITTDDTELAGTKASPKITLNYTSRSGRKVSTDAKDLDNASQDFYGYWPSTTGTDIVGQQSTGAGGQVKILYNIVDDDVNSFDSVHIAMPDNANDDWQITSIKIMKLTSIGPRQGEWTPVYDNSGTVLLSDRRYDREVSGDILLEQNGKILLQDGDEKNLEIEGGKIIEKDDDDENWEDIRYFMDAETAQSMLGFQKTRATYTVNVKVANENSSTINDGDCGSINNFYFQLVFANGKSGYVLANQQLSGDGFRTGHEETFSISTNRDYGELQSVRIIPDDNSKDSSIFDKLNIDKITVSRGSNTAVSRTWVIENVGWIEIDYHDDAESYGINGRKGRPENLLARSFAVSYPTYSIKLLFSLGTSEMDPNTDDMSSLLEGKDAETQAKIIEALTNVNQYQGEVSLILYYRNSKKEIVPYECDLVKAIADYANKSVYREERTDSEGNIIQGRQYKSDATYMFRPGHLDRFELTLNDATELLSAEIIATGIDTQSTFWKIASCNAMLLTESGELNINSQGEYEKTNAITAQELCEGIGLPRTLWCPARNAEAMEFTFSNNEISVDLEDNTWEVAPSRTPESENDVANIYVYLAEDSAVPADLMSLISYTTGYGQAYQSATRGMGYDSARRMFSVSGVDISKIAVLNSISMTMSSANTPGIYIDHVVVQQIRSDVVINTYNFVPATEAERILRGTLTIKPTGGGGAVISGDKQVATIRFGADTETTRLVEENRDIAVALRYTSLNDGNGREYNSPYIYLTDQQIVAIRAGGTAEITFHEKYVGEVKGLVVLATGKLRAEVDMASVGVYRDNLTGDSQDCVGWYSFAENVKLGVAAYTMKPIADHTRTTLINAQRTVSPLLVTVTTGTTDQDPNPGTTDPVRMTVTYLDNGNPETLKTVTFSDIRDNLVSGSFDAGQTASVRVMLQGVKELRSITLEPYSTDPDKTSTDAWYISGMSLQMNQNLKLVKYETGAAQKAIEKKAALYNVADVSLVVEARVVNDGITSLYYSDAGAISVSVKPGQPVSLTATLNGSDSDIKVEVLSNGVTLDEDKTVSGGNYTFTNSTAGTYQVVFTSVEMPSIGETVTVRITAEEQPEEDKSIRLSETSVTIDLADADPTKILTVSNADGDVLWRSMNGNVATVANGLVEGIAVGEAKIIALDNKGNQASCIVKVINSAIPEETP